VVGRGSSLVGGLVLGVLGLSLVLHISDVARVGISNSVGDNLGPAVGKLNAVLSVGGVVVAVLIGSKVGARVAILDSISVVVDSRAIIRRLSMVSWGRGMVSRGRGVVGSGSRGVVGSGSRGMVGSGSRGMVGRGRGMVSRGRGGMVGRGRRVVSRGSMVDWGRGMVSRGRMVDRGSAMDGLVSVFGDGSVVVLRILLLVVVLSDLSGEGRGLAVNSSMLRAMRLGDGGGYGRGIALLEGLMVDLVGRGTSQEGKNCDESLHVDVITQMV
jgi:hypothetical protein